jgi:hypothetical protein
MTRSDLPGQVEAGGARFDGVDRHAYEAFQPHALQVELFVFWQRDDVQASVI